MYVCVNKRMIISMKLMVFAFVGSCIALLLLLVAAVAVVDGDDD